MSRTLHRKMQRELLRLRIKGNWQSPPKTQGHSQRLGSALVSTKFEGMSKEDLYHSGLRDSDNRIHIYSDCP